MVGYGRGIVDQYFDWDSANRSARLIGLMA